MRRALFGFLLGATMATPMAAYAQDADAEPEVRAQRAERQQVRSEQRTERRQERSEQRVERRSEPRTDVAVNTDVSTRRGDRSGTGRTERRLDQPVTETAVPRTEDRARNWPGQTGRTRQVVTEQSRRADWQNDRRGDRTDRNDRRSDHTDRTDNRRGDWNGRNDRRGDWNGRNDNRRDWNRNWRNDNRYDWQRWRSSNRNIFHIGPYYSPFRNYSYNRFSIGFRLGSSFYSDRYWINDPWQYRLPPAYAGTRWIRYYDDVLLVDLYTGEVVDVIYDFFW